MVTKIYVSPGLNYTFFGFEWLRNLHGTLMYYYFGAMVLLSLMVAFGYFYRISIFLLAVFWSGFYFSCKAHYNNHYYLMVLLCWMMALMPAHKRFSVDAKLNPGIATGQCYKWQLQLFVFQVACMYIFAAIAKINYDWLHAIPFKTWLPLKANSFFFGRILRNPIMPWVIVYGGLLFDLFVIPGLLYRRTRPLFFILLIGFHLFNGIVFKIGSFPFLAVSLCVFFYPAANFDKFLGSANLQNFSSNFSTRKIKLINAAIAAYAALQVFLPLRHFLIKGDVGWTEEGHRMAWQMMLRSKFGDAYFEVKDKKTDSSWIVNPTTFVNKESLREVAVLPDVTWQAAQDLQKTYALQQKDVAVYAHCNVRLNFRTSKPLIDTTVDLGGVKWNYFGHNKWILLYDK